VDTLAIAEYLNELFPEAQMLPAEKGARARCRSIAGEMHSGFAALRSSLPMNLRFRKPGFTFGPPPRPTSTASPRSGGLFTTWKAISVRQKADDCRCDVCASGDAVLSYDVMLARSARIIAIPSWPGRR